MLFRVKRDGFTWGGKIYDQGEILDIEDGHPRVRALIEQSHILEYANCDMPEEPQGRLVESLPQERIVHNPSLATTDPRAPQATLEH